MAPTPYAWPTPLGALLQSSSSEGSLSGIMVNKLIVYSEISEYSEHLLE